MTPELLAIIAGVILLIGLIWVWWPDIRREKPRASVGVEWQGSVRPKNMREDLGDKWTKTPPPDWNWPEWEKYRARPFDADRD